MAKSLICLRGVNKQYQMGDVCVTALKNISLDINEGDYIALTGASGSGKSTLLNILGCLDIPDSGTYLFDGKDISRLSRNELSKVRRDMIGFIFQSYNLLPRANAIENVELPLMYSNYCSESDMKSRARSVLEKVGLKERILHYPSQLSGGQQQRVAIARALVNNPRLILADEPTGNLDSKSGAEIISLLQEINRTGTTIVKVTHDIQLAQQANKLISMKDGEINN